MMRWILASKQYFGSADITSISELVDAKQHDLFFDVETLATRGLSFMRETKEWFERWNARQ
jgi:hypothetical protein